MTNTISDLFMNMVQPSAESSKSTQNSVKDSSVSFDKILNNYNQSNAASTAQNNYADKKSLAPEKKTDNSNLKKSDDYSFNDKNDDKIKNSKSDCDKVNEKDNQSKSTDKNYEKDIKDENLSKNTAEKQKNTVEEDEKRVKSSVKKDDYSTEKTTEQSSVLDADKVEEIANSDKSENIDSEDQSNQESEQKQVQQQSTVQVQISLFEQSVAQAINPDLQLNNQTELSSESKVLNDLSQADSKIQAENIDTPEMQINIDNLADAPRETKVQQPIQNKSELNTKVEIDINTNELNIKENLSNEQVAIEQNMEVSADDMPNTIQIKVSNDVQVDSSRSKDNQIEINNQQLNQSVISEIDAEVVNYNNNSSSNFSNQQNASEQIVKLSIESLSSSSEPSDFTNIINHSNGQLAQDKIQVNTAPISAKELTKFDIMNQIAEKLPTLKAGTEKVEIILKPENLGKVNVELESTRGVVNATLIAENKQVKELLEKNIDTLRNNLTAQGVNVNTVTVKVEEPTKSAFNAFDFNQNNFGSDTTKHQNSFSETQNADYDANGSSNILGSDENVATATENNTEAGKLHSGMVDYKV